MVGGSGAGAAESAARGPALSGTAGDGGPPGADLDLWLARAAADRDEGAFEQLVRRHTGALYHGALRTTGSPQLAEEVVQEAWLSAWAHLAGFRGHSAVRTWLIRIVTTKALNAVRRSHRTHPLDAVPEALTTSIDDPERDAELRERARAVRQAVAALPARQREAVVLRDLEGLSYEQVAQTLDCSVPSVKSALHRGRQALARALAQYRPDPQPASGRGLGAAVTDPPAGWQAHTGQHHV